MAASAIKTDPDILLNRRTLFLALWDSMGRIRFLLCSVVFLYSFVDPNVKSRGQLWILIAVYAGFNFSLRLFGSSILYLKRVRMIPSFADVVFVSLIIHNSTGPGNSWFLFYIFPIISVSKYLGYWGTLSLAGCSVASYLIVYLSSRQSLEIEPHWFVLRCLVLVGVGAVAGSLARTRQKELVRLTKVHEEIDRAILRERQLDQILNLILKKALLFTNSAMGHIRLLDRETGEDQIVTTIGYVGGDAEGIGPLDDGFARRAIKQRVPIIVPQIRRKELQDYWGTYFMSLQPKPNSALLVPLRVNESIIGIIVVYSHWSHHFTKTDEGRLTAFTPLIEMAIKTVESAESFRKLAEAESYYHDLIEEAPDPIIVLDKDGNIKVFNKACRALWGFTEEEVKGQPVENYYESREYAREIARMLWQSKGNRKENFEARIKAKNGEIIPISLSACFLTDDTGEVNRSIGVFKDRRDAIKMSEEVLRAERLAMVGRLAGTAGHDIKHHIGAALNYVESLLYKCDPAQESELREVYSIVYSSLQESVARLKSLLTAHQPGLPDRSESGIKEIFQVLEENMRRQALDKNVELNVNYPESDLRLSVDIEQMAEVLSNLFTNSLYAIEKRRDIDGTLERGLIEVSASTTNEHVQLTWRDNGSGIPESEHKNIFNAYVTSKGSKGTGLGLFIVKMILENHDGRIEVTSTVGGGATFRITLPIVNAGDRLKR
jgi:PAS domain S-box-containing protein